MDHRNLIVVGVDGSPGSRRALRWALGEADRSNAELAAVTVWTWDGLEGPMLAATDPGSRREHAERVSAHEVQGAVAGHEAPVRVTRTVIEGHPVRELLTASRHARLLVLGSNGHGRLYRMVLGSISGESCRRAPCPVVVIPADETHEEPAGKSNGQPAPAIRP
jgi:nucleotide-binding universal stress UspA family protein